MFVVWCVTVVCVLCDSDVLCAIVVLCVTGVGVVWYDVRELCVCDVRVALAVDVS